MKPKVRRRKEIIKVGELNEIKNKKTTEKINAKQKKGWFFEKVNKMDKPLATLTKEKREKRLK